MDRLNPGYKFLTLLIVSMTLSLTYNIRLNLLVFFLSFTATLCTPSVNKKRLFLGLIPFLLLAAGMFMSGLIFPAEGGAATGSEGFRAVYVDSIDTALQLSSRVLAFGGVGMLFALTTDSMDFIMGLMQQFRLPPKFAYGLLAAYHFFPVVRNEYRVVKSGLKVRGIKAGPLSRKRVFPLIVHAFEQSESIAMAMESRGFCNEAPRTVAFVVPLRRVDIVFLAVAVGGVIAGAIWL